MTRIINAKKKVSRKLRVNLWGSDKDPFLKKNYKPGQHGANLRTRPTDYGNQLRAKQILKSYYANMTERQFRNIFKEAAKNKGDTGENFITLLELRLDVVIYRANFVKTMFAARQFISHKHITINDKVVNISSYRLKIGDVVKIKDKHKDLALVVESLASSDKRDIAPYLEVNEEDRSVKITSEPNFSDVPYPIEIETNLIVEFYSR
ncbi:30S ribosomal protein S4 [Flavobacteriaceae bacterium]|nr:30S ribosomal protein S4 [Flavobacteriaceae bacterium]